MIYRRNSLLAVTAAPNFAADRPSAPSRTEDEVTELFDRWGSPLQRYLITPALGGSDNVRDFWPQSYKETVWNAHIKDALEDHLHSLVCGR